MVCTWTTLLRDGGTAVKKVNNGDGDNGDNGDNGDAARAPFLSPLTTAAAAAASTPPPPPPLAPPPPLGFLVGKDVESPSR